MADEEQQQRQQIQQQQQQQQQLLQQQQQQQVAPQPDNLVAAVPVESIHSCRLPPFWKASPEAWFLQVEAALAGNQIKHDLTRYNLALAKLDGDTVHELLDVLRAVPATGKFAYLKQHVIQRFGDTLEERLNQLLSTVGTEGRKPSHLLRHIRRLAGDRATDDLLKVKWLNLLPSNARGVLSVLDTASLDKLAEAADKFMDTMPSAHAVGPGGTTRPPSPGRGSHRPHSVSPSRRGFSSMSHAPAAISVNANGALDSMAADTAALRSSMSQLLSINRLMLDRLSEPPAGQQHGGRGRSRSRSQQQRSSSSAQRDCFYHRRFGAGAHNCVSLCGFDVATNGAGN